MRRIILPQAVVMMLPSFGNLLIELLKGTSLLSLITIAELTFRGRVLLQTTGDATTIYTIILLMYFAMAFPLALAVRRLERRLSGHLTVIDPMTFDVELCAGTTAHAPPGDDRHGHRDGRWVRPGDGHRSRPGARQAVGRDRHPPGRYGDTPSSSGRPRCSSSCSSCSSSCRRYGLAFGALATGIVGLGLHYSAYLAEVYRAGIEAVPRGQWEAATSLNMSRRR